MKFTKPKPKRPVPVDPKDLIAKNTKTQPNPTLPNWDGMVQKADGSVGMWGNNLKKSSDSEKVNLYPKGVVEKRQVDSLKRTDPKLSKLIGEPTRRHKTSQAQYGTQSSDLIKKLLK